MARAKADKRASLSIEDFRYLDDLGLASPQLILGIEVDPRSFGSDYPPRAPRFRAGRDWANLAHQTAGVACKQRFLMATVLAPTPAATLAMARLSEARIGTGIGAGGVSLVDVLAYRDDVKRLLGADCNTSYSALAEGYYPIDVEFAYKLTTTPLPAALDDLVDWTDGMERARGAMGRWKLAVLGRNES